VAGEVNDGDGTLGVLHCSSTVGGGDKRPNLVDVDDRAVVLVLGVVEVSHTDLTEVTRMVLVHVDSVVVLLKITKDRRLHVVLSFLLLYKKRPCNRFHNLLDHQQDHDHQDAYGAFLIV
jgi:hypothetical protein